MYAIARDRSVMGELVNSRALSAAQLASLCLVLASVITLAVAVAA